MLEYFILPGYGNSGPKHWQTHWEKMDSSFTRVEQRDWERPLRTEWVEALEAKVSAAGDHIILVAHSLACLLVAHWALGPLSSGASPRNRLKVKGAFLVGVPDPEGPNFPVAAEGFAPLPLQVLPFPSLVVASTNDQYASTDFARNCARAWGGGITVIGAKGHINSESGLGVWEEGRKMLDAFTLL